MEHSVQSHLSKSQKKKLRKSKSMLDASKSKSAQAETCGTGYKYNCHGGGKYFLYRTSTYERFPETYFLKDPSKTENQIFTILVAKVCETEVGISYPGVVESLTQNLEFKIKALRFIHSFQRLNLKAMLDHHCPKLASNIMPVNIENLFSFLKSIFFRSSLFDLVSFQTHALEVCLKKCLTKTKSSFNLVGELLEGFQPKKVLWLRQYTNALQTNILAKLVCWLIYTFTHLIITSFFHPTDSTHRRHQILFYRKSVWQSVTTTALSTLIRSGRLHPLKSSSLAKVLSSPSAPDTVNLRFIPKRDVSKIRPISMKSKTTKFNPALASLAKQFAGLFPAKSDLSGHTLHKEWSKLVLGLEKDARLYWITADISDAFGSIKIPKLCQILKDLSVKCPHFPNVRIRTSELCGRLVLHTASYKLGNVKKTFLLTQGVIQGDPLSSNLSDIYYGDLITTFLLEFLTVPEGEVEIFLRGADDFLYVSTNRGRVQMFQQLIKSGFPSHNCYFKPSKTLTNADTADQTAPIPYCGSLLHLESREISPNYSSYADTNMCSSQMGPKVGVKPGQFITVRFVFFCKIRQTSLYFGGYNSRVRLLTTLAANVSLALRRLTCMLDCLIWSRKRVAQERWLWETWMTGFRMFKGSSRRAGINPVQVKWVALHCLRVELKRSSQYSRKMRLGVKNAIARVNLSDDKVSYLAKIVTNAHKNIKYSTIHAKAGFKYLSY